VLGGAAVILVVGIVAAIFIAGGGSSTNSGNNNQAGTVPASVLQAITNPNPSLFSSVGTGGQSSELVRVAGSSTLKDSAGKPLVVYVGAEYCPFCAAERWSLIMALSRFGSFSGLKTMTSASSPEVFPDTHTFTFVNSSFSSSSIGFSSTELENRSQQPLQTMNSQVSNLFQTVNRPPYTAQAQQFPFVDIGGRYILYQTSYSPQVLQGLSWQQVADDLSNPQSPVTQAIVGSANYLTAAVCSASQNQPASVCSTPVIQGIESTLNAMPPTSG
jgi:thiol-disulfide isomerase/thioredoxin